MLYGFIRSAINLKNLPRQGWIRVGIPPDAVESIADHSYNTAMLSLLLSDIHNILYPDNPLNSEHVMRIAIVHDLPECQFQDFDRQIQVLLGEDAYNELKHKLLINASTELLSLIINKEVKEQWKKMFNDVIYTSSPESQFVKYIDKMEVLIQALAYERLGYDSMLFDDFWKTGLQYLKDCPFSVITDLVKILEKERKKNG